MNSRYPLAAAVALALTLAACSSSSKSSSSSSVAATGGPSTTLDPARAALASIGAATASGLTLSLAKGSQGIFLIGPNGHTLYVFDKDSGTTSACISSGCMQTWPALAAASPATTGTAVTKDQVSTATGQVANQVTYYGHLLYYFSGDNAPGDTNGTKITGWNLLGPFGNVMLPR